MMRVLFFILTLFLSAPAFSQIGMTLRRDAVADTSGGGPTYDTAPDSISNLIAWWEADSGVTESGGAVSAWEDQIGGYIVDESGIQQPTYSSSVSVLNNQPGINFDGNNDWLSLLGSTIPIGSDFTVIVVCHPETSTTEMRPIGWEFSSAENSLIIPVRMYSTNTSLAFGRTSFSSYNSNSPSGSFSSYVHGSI